MKASTAVTAELAPILVGAGQAAAMAGVSRSTWLAWDSAGLCPRSIRIGGRVLWSRRQLGAWAENACPSRESADWEAILTKLRDAGVNGGVL